MSSQGQGVFKEPPLLKAEDPLVDLTVQYGRRPLPERAQMGVQSLGKRKKRRKSSTSALLGTRSDAMRNVLRGEGTLRSASGGKAAGCRKSAARTHVKETGNHIPRNPCFKGGMERLNHSAERDREE